MSELICHLILTNQLAGRCHPNMAKLHTSLWNSRAPSSWKTLNGLSAFIFQNVLWSRFKIVNNGWEWLTMGNIGQQCGECTTVSSVLLEPKQWTTGSIWGETNWGVNSKGAVPPMILPGLPRLPYWVMMIPAEHNERLLCMAPVSNHVLLISQNWWII